MRARSLADLAALLEATVEPEHAGDLIVSRVSADTRDDVEGSVFVALRGERVDAHDLLDRAFAGGAAAALVSRPGAVPGPAVRVADTRAALLAIAGDTRSRFAGPVIGITGSTGKTCTKDFAAAVLSSRFRVHASPRSFNTEVGLPLTILNAPEEAEALVLEMGSRGIGHIARLCQTARPTVGVVTNVGTSHLGMFGSRENIARAKAELVEALPAEGIAVLNADDPVVSGFRERTPARVVTYGVTGEPDVLGRDVVLDRDALATFTLSWRGEEAPVELAVPGEHLVPDALAAAAAGLALGVTVAECAAALKGASVSAWRMEVHVRADGVRVVNDAYNANPASMAAALKAGRWMARDGRSVAVLGEMAELGDAAVEEHDRIGGLIARLGVGELIVVGEAARAIARGAVREGVGPDHVHEVDTVEEALAAARALVRPGDVVVVKASRAVGLDAVARALVEDAA